MSDVLLSDAGSVGAKPTAIVRQIQNLLVAGEMIVEHAVQIRIFALTHRRHVAAATTGRFLYLKRRLFGGYDPFDIRWQDVKDARVAVGAFSATVTVVYNANLSDTAVGDGDTRFITIRGLGKNSAQALYRHCQGEEQAWREKRRIRSLEEMRAQAGGVQIATGVYPPPGGDKTYDPSTVISPSVEDPTDRLSRAKDMLGKGLITDAEYEGIKAKIVSAL